MLRYITLAALGLTLATAPAKAGSGDLFYHARTVDGGVELQLTEHGGGQLLGVLRVDDFPVRVTAMREKENLHGEIGEGYEVYRFTARIEGDALRMRFEDSTEMVLSAGRLSNANSPATQEPSASGQASGADISINGQKLTPEQVGALAQYGIQAQSGRYWYDAVSGAWGAWGGPTAGFVAAGIPSAPLPANASNGATGVHINGRNVTHSELAYLQNLAGSAIAPGQYWLDANGNAGAAGGPALINFLQAAQSQQGSSWVGKGATGYTGADGSGGVWIANPYGGTGTTVTY